MIHEIRCVLCEPELVRRSRSDDTMRLFYAFYYVLINQHFEYNE